MIGTIDLRCNAANPNMPLKTLFAYVNSPSSLRIIDVPKKIGKWTINQVFISATYPDNSIASSECVLVGGCWTGTIDGSTSVGKSLNGYTVSANGTDEKGNPVTGYVMGKGDVVILDADGRTIIDGKVTYLHLLDGMPDDPKEGDVILENENWKIWHDGDWIDFGGKNPTWGIIEGDIDDQADLHEKFVSIYNELADDERDIEETNGRVDSISSDLNTAKTDVAGIKSKIPNAATAANQLADKDFVNSSINNFAAFYITKNAAGDAFATKAELMSATVYYSGGQVRVPTKNDYTIVLEDETKTTSLGVNPTTRYTYNSQWEYQYIVNNTSLTQAQVNAINSGVTKDIVDNRVIPSETSQGWAANADYAKESYYSYDADYSREADYASTAGVASGASSANDDGETLSWSEVVQKYAPPPAPSAPPKNDVLIVILDNLASDGIFYTKSEDGVEHRYDRNGTYIIPRKDAYMIRYTGYMQSGNIDCVNTRTGYSVYTTTIGGEQIMAVLYYTMSGWTRCTSSWDIGSALHTWTRPLFNTLELIGDD